MSPGCVGFHPSSSRMTALEAGMSAARKPASQAKCSPSSSSATQTTGRWETAADDLGDVADRNALVGAHRLTHGGVHGGDTRRRRGRRRPLLLGHDNRQALASEGRAVEMDELGNHAEASARFSSPPLRKSGSITAPYAASTCPMCAIRTRGWRPKQHGRSLPLRTSTSTPAPSAETSAPPGRTARPRQP